VVEIRAYRSLPASYRDYDPEASAVAQALIALIREQDDALHLEHIGSSAVPGCGGKGYVDLLVIYPQGRLDAAKRALQALGFQRQQSRDPFPEDRPMRVGIVEHQGREFSVHVHVIANDSTEAVELVRFRDRLRADAGLRVAYEQEKRRILGAGVTDAEDYAQAKTEFIRRVVAQS
jgi:GrpB-like predicted nucleotidyltransferase (UPF0157 family)